MRYHVAALSLGAACALIIVGAAAQGALTHRIGSAIVVQNLVTAQLARDTRTLIAGDAVHQNETIEVGLDGASELEFKDNTKLALGPGSRLVLDRFVYESDRAGSSIVLSLAKGAFRFITGVAAKPAYVIRMPAAAIAVRGTKFDAFVHQGGEALLLLHEGAVEVCNFRGKCRVHDEPGKLLRVTEDGDVGVPIQWPSLRGILDVSFDDAFPFVVSPPTIDPHSPFTREAILNGKLYSPALLKRRVLLPPAGRKNTGKRIIDAAARLVPRIREHDEQDNDWDDDDDDQDESDYYDDDDDDDELHHNRRVKRAIGGWLNRKGKFRKSRKYLWD